MRPENQLISMAALVLSFLLFFLGLFLFSIPYVSALRQEMLVLLTEKPEVFLGWGVAVMLAGLLLITLFYWISKKRFLVIKMGELSIHEDVLVEMTRQVLHSFFPSQSCYCDVAIRGRYKVKIFVHLPAVDRENREPLLKQLEHKLVSSLASICGWKREFSLNVSFIPIPPRELDLGNAKAPAIE